MCGMDHHSARVFHAMAGAAKPLYASSVTRAIQNSAGDVFPFAWIAASEPCSAPQNFVAYVFRKFLRLDRGHCSELNGNETG